MLRLFSILLATLTLGHSVSVAQPVAGDADSSRVLRTFDFEERKLGNVEDLPMYWSKLGGDGFPHYVNGQLSTDRAQSGKYSFRFDLNGGSLVYRYEAGRIKVQQDAHYRVETYCQTTPLKHARARVSAYFTDLDNHTLPETIVHSKLFATPAEQSEWSRLSVELTASNPKAAYLVIELSLLQPAQYQPPTTLGAQALYPQDIRGSAWFDDLHVSQVPQVLLSTDRPGNIFRQGDSPRLQVVVNDKFTDDLSAQLVITGADGKSVYQRSGALDMATAEVLGPNRKRVVMPLPQLAAGWYQAALVMSSRGQYVGEQQLAVIQLADNGTATVPDQRFGVTALDLPFEGWDELPQILPFLSAGRVKLAVWSAAGDIQNVDSDKFDHLLEQLQELGITPTACLVDLPPELSKKLNNGSWPSLLNAPKEVWQPQLAYLLARHANHLDRWQLGADGTDAFVTNPAMRKAYKLVYAEFADLMQKPDLAMPWPAWYELDGEMPATVALSVPPSVLPSQLPLYMNDLNGKGPGLLSDLAPKTSAGPTMSISLELLDANQYGRETQIRDLTERVIYALAAGASRIDLPLPFTVTKTPAGITKQPQEMLLIQRTLISALSGATYMGKLPMAEGIEAFLFDRSGQGIVILWDRSAVPGDKRGTVKQLTIDLGEQPARLDLWGNVSPLLAAPAAQGAGKMLLSVGSMPTILINVDGQLAQLRASVGIDNPLLESSFEPHTRHVRFTNPYKQSIAGQFKLRAPKGWTLNPPTFTFNLNPGEVFDREITIEFPYNSFAGPKTLSAEFVVQADRNISFTSPIAVNLGLSDVGIQTLALRDGKDVLVQQMISNYGNKPIDYTAFAIFPGQARQERLVTNLGAGRTTLKRYKFTNVTVPENTAIRSGLKEMVGTRVLNEEVPIQ